MLHNSYMFAKSHPAPLQKPQSHHITQHRRKRDQGEIALVVLANHCGTGLEQFPAISSFTVPTGVSPKRCARVSSIRPGLAAIALPMKSFPSLIMHSMPMP